MQQTFDVLIVDLKMEEMDGMVFIGEALKIWPDIGVIVISAYVSREIPKQAAELGVTRILDKPVDIATFVTAIEEEGAARQRTESNIQETDAVALMREHLKLLAGIGHRSLSTETPAGALHEFGDALASMVSADLVGILVEEEDQGPHHDPLCAVCRGARVYHQRRRGDGETIQDSERTRLGHGDPAEPPGRG
jgi:CheY-like chemotaxis protein